MDMASNQSLGRRHFLRLGLGGAGGLAHGAIAEFGVAAPGMNRYTRTAQALGTDVRFTVLHADEATAAKAVDEALAGIAHVEGLMSLYRAESQLSVLNREGFLRDPHPDLYDVLRRAMALSERTGGAFDVTVQPLWQLFAARARQGKLPTDEEIRAVRRRVGWRLVELSPEQILTKVAGVRLTLNGVAQGLAADVARAALRNRGVEHALIDAGELNAMGRTVRADGWAVGIEHPRKPGRLIGRTALSDRCLSTSGDYSTGFSCDHRHHHLFDPRTGRSPTELASVSVAAPSALEADALSTALIVMGEEEGLRLLRTMDRVDALFVTKAGEIRSTDGFGLL